MLRYRRFAQRAIGTQLRRASSGRRGHSPPAVTESQLQNDFANVFAHLVGETPMTPGETTGEGRRAVAAAAPRAPEDGDSVVSGIDKAGNPIRSRNRVPHVTVRKTESRKPHEEAPEANSLLSDVERARAKWEASGRALEASHPFADPTKGRGIAEIARRRGDKVEQAIERVGQMGAAKADAPLSRETFSGLRYEDPASGEIVSAPPRRIHDMVFERVEELETLQKVRDAVSTHLPRRLARPGLLLDDAPRAREAVTEGYDPLSLPFGGAWKSHRDAASAPLASIEGFRQLFGDGASTISQEPTSNANSSAEPTGFGADRIEKRDDEDKGVQLLRAIQRAGLCSRREALERISAGKVTVNQRIVRNPFEMISSDDDLHAVGFPERLRFAPPRLWLFHKPMNTLIGSKNDPKRVWFLRYAQMLGHEHLAPIGSLPFRAHGLMLLTNDGDLAGFLSHPQAKVQQTWVVRCNPPISPLLAHKLNAEGVDINGVRHHQFEFSHFGSRRSKQVVRIRVKDSQAIPVHVMLQHLGRKISRGARRSVGPYYVGGLQPGGMKEVALPPFYARYVNTVWQPFIDRDWPYFRRLRVEKLSKLAKYRNLTDDERNELDSFAADELRHMSESDAAEIEHEAARFAEQLRERPNVPLPPLPPASSDDDVEWL